jgi:parallel beta-helix repeat protein
MQADGMNTRYLVIFISIVLTTNCFFSFYYSNSCKADIPPKFYVDDDYNSLTPGWQIDHFNVIQDAIDASQPTDRIIVYAGTYNEILTINHKLDLFGEDKNLCIIDGGNTGDVITILATYVNISHFTIRDCKNNVDNATIKVHAGNAIITDNIITSPGGYHGIIINNCDNNLIYDNSIKNNNGNGIFLNHSDYNQITYNTVNNNLNGIFVYNSSNNIIENNSAMNNNNVNGIFLNETSNYNSISNNILYSNTGNGIFINDHCNFNAFSNNEITSNSDSGIRMENSSSNTIANITVSENENYGIMIVGSNNKVQDSTINSNEEHGIFLFADDNNIIARNTISSNTKDGVSLSNSTIDTIYSNEIKNNLRYGINLDFFTVSNTIYNNYIHDNAENGMDKSLNHNYWNISKTTGTNIVGGPYICGNYWDSFDETSEGIVDSDNDGISDSVYTIYASNQDQGPILDVIAPIIGNPQVSPSSQAIGGFTYISVQITDNTIIKEVYIDIIIPNGQVQNFSITGNKTGNVWSCYEQFTPVGLFSFHIAAKDPRNWETSPSFTFYVHEGTPPTITDNSPVTGSPSAVYTFNATVVDDQDPASDLTVKVKWHHGDKSGNYSMVNTYEDFFIAHIILDNSIASLTYTIFASDQWSNSITTETQSVSLTDTIAPEIIINTYGPSSDNMPNKYIFGATITDNHGIKEAKIEYWPEGSTHVIVDLDRKNANNYEKEIIFNTSTDRVYCIIYATDPSGNKNNTKSPFSNANGPYFGVIAKEVSFDGSQSFDLDGTIIKYEWDFGDGTTGVGLSTNHIYTSKGNYTVTLTVTDNDGNTNSNKVNANIISSVKKTTSSDTISEIENIYGITLNELFYSYDTDGDRIVDKFIDPNDELVSVHSGNIDIEGNIVFLLSYDGNDDVPNFIWNSTTDEIMMINYIVGEILENRVDEINKIVTTIVKGAKLENWIYLEVAKPKIDEYGIIDNLISVTKNNTDIESDKLIQKEDKIYVLDDPVEVYEVRFSYKPPPLMLIDISPKNGIVNQNNPTITFTFNYPVTITYADFYMENLSVELTIIGDIVTKDYYTFSYTPPSTLKKGIYYLDIDVMDEYGKTLTVNDNYFQFQPYTFQESEIPIYSFLIFLGMLGGIGAIFYLIIRYKNINFESFVYFKNKKIIPFFKPLVFGPLRIDVDDEKIKKAEFFVNGELKTTLTEAPFIWNWNETSFMKKTIEAKVYDDQGNTRSSGEMTFFIFNSPWLFK